VIHALMKIPCQSLEIIAIPCIYFGRFPHGFGDTHTFILTCDFNLTYRKIKSDLCISCCRVFACVRGVFKWLLVLVHLSALTVLSGAWSGCSYLSNKIGY
jgi:hypothetical protein